jgi:hypothetical protein
LLRYVRDGIGAASHYALAEPLSGTRFHEPSTSVPAIFSLPIDNPNREMDTTGRTAIKLAKSRAHYLAGILGAPCSRGGIRAT